MVNAYIVWLGLLCDGSCSLCSVSFVVDHRVNLFSWIPAFMRSFAITTSHCCLNRSVALGTCKEKDFPFSTCLFTSHCCSPIHLGLLLDSHLALQSICSRNKQILQDPIELTLASLAVLLVIFERLSSLAALRSVNSRHSGFWVQFELKSDRSCLHIFFFYAFCISDELRVFVYSDLVICTINKRGLQQYVFSTWLRAVNDKKLKIWNVTVRYKTLRWTDKYTIMPEVWSKQNNIFFEHPVCM